MKYPHRTRITGNHGDFTARCRCGWKRHVPSHRRDVSLLARAHQSAGVISIKTNDGDILLTGGNAARAFAYEVLGHRSQWPHELRGEARDLLALLNAYQNDSLSGFLWGMREFSVGALDEVDSRRELVRIASLLRDELPALVGTELLRREEALRLKLGAV